MSMSAYFQVVVGVVPDDLPGVAVPPANVGLWTAMLIVDGSRPVGCALPDERRPFSHRRGACAARDVPVGDAPCPLHGDGRTGTDPDPAARLPAPASGVTLKPCSG